MTNELQIFKNDLFEVAVTLENGQVLFDAETVARCLGFTTVAKSGNEVVRWARVNEYLKGKVSQDIAKGDLIPEPMVYKLAFKASNETAEKFQDWLAIEVIPSIRKTGVYTIPTMSQAELTAMIAQNQVEIEKKATKALELAEKADKQINNALDVFTSPIDEDWQDSMNSKMRGMCQKYGLNYPVFYGDLYAELETVARVDLKNRQTKLRNRMLANGATKTACKNVTKLEIIERDPKLRPIFEGIVRKYQAKYALDWTPVREQA